MGTFLGHAATGSFFLFLGLFIFLRSLGLRKFHNLRVSDKWVMFPSFVMLCGGIIYNCGEFLSWLTSYPTYNHIQHFLMAFWFCIGGLSQFLHMNRKLKGAGFCIIQPIMFVILSIQFNTHVQPLPSLSVGHKFMSTLFIILALVDAFIVFSGHIFNTKHIKSRLATMYSVHSQKSVLSSCECGCGIKVSNILPMYNNPVIYTTGLSTLKGFLLMLLGVVDWRMAVTFFRQQALKVSMDKLYQMEVGDNMMNMGDDGDHMSPIDMATMKAQDLYLWLTLGTIFVQLLICLILKKFDDKEYPQSTEWRDTLFNSPIPATSNDEI